MSLTGLGLTLATNWGSIATVLLVIVGLAVLYKRGKKDQVKTIILALVKTAEDKYGRGAGGVKYAAVITALYDKLPLIVKVLFTKEEINTYIDAALHYISKAVTHSADQAKETAVEETTSDDANKTAEEVEKGVDQPTADQAAITAAAQTASDAAAAAKAAAGQAIKAAEDAAQAAKYVAAKTQ